MINLTILFIIQQISNGNAILSYFVSFLGYLQQGLFITQYVTIKNIDARSICIQGTYFRNINTRNIHTKDTCTKKTYIKNAFNGIIFAKNICAKGTSAVKHLKIYLQLF